MATANLAPSGKDDSIRLPAGIDPLVGKDVTAAQLNATISEVREEYGPLYDRKWQHISAGKGPGITLLQYNILAHGLSNRPTDKSPFDATDTGGGHPDMSFYGGFDSVPNPEKVFDFSKRRVRLLEDILQYDPDIITLQECDHFHDFFEPALQKFGYEGLFQPKSEAPGCKSGFYSDGVGVLWKADQFRRDGDAHCGSYMGTGPDAVKLPHAIVPLLPVARAAGPAQRLIVVTTHLKAKANVASEAIRATQITALLGLAKTFRKDGDAMIVAGDYNADPIAVQGGGETIEPKTVNATLDSGLSLASAYKIPESLEDPAYTTWKSRNGKEIRHVIDYIFYSTSELECIDVLGPPAAADLEPSRLPGMKAPSDHLAIAAKFVIVPSTRH